MPVDHDYEAKVLALITEALPKKAKKTKLTAETRLQRDLGLDSIAMLALLFRFEKTFEIDLTQVDVSTTIQQMRTVGDALALGRQVIEQARAKSSSA